MTKFTTDGAHLRLVLGLKDAPTFAKIPVPPLKEGMQELSVLPILGTAASGKGGKQTVGSRIPGKTNMGLMLFSELLISSHRSLMASVK